MAVSCIRNIWSVGDPIQDLEFCGGAEEKKPSKVMFTSQQANAASGIADPIYLSEAYLYRDLDHDHRVKVASK